jgi:hypothetical protein
VRWCSFSMLLHEVDELASGFPSFMFQSVRQATNNAAHYCANFACTHGQVLVESADRRHLEQLSCWFYLVCKKLNSSRLFPKKKFGCHQYSSNVDQNKDGIDGLTLKTKLTFKKQKWPVVIYAWELSEVTFKNCTKFIPTLPDKKIV